MSRTLHCEIGDHDWVQESWGRGRPPKNCPVHKAGTPTEEKPQDEPKENPFIKKANPFLAKAQTKCERCNNNERMEGESICFDCMEAETNPDAEVEVETQTTAPEPVQEVVKPPKNKPATFRRIDHDQIVDEGTYKHPSLPGVRIHNVERDLHGFWKCQVTVNEETLYLIRRGGWIIQLEDGKMRAVKPNVAAVIAEIVARLQPKPEPDEKKKVKRDQKTLEQVADDVVPFEEGHEDKVDKRRRRTDIVEEGDTQAAQSIMSDAMANDPYAEGGEMNEAHQNNLEALNDEDDEFDDMAAAFSALDF
jgi:hypothetical protein